MSGIAILYRWRVEPGHEESFQASWREATLRLRAEGVARGSCLTKDENGEFVAIALWPSLVAREQAFASLPPFAPWPGVARISETRLTVVENLWAASALGDDQA